MKSKVAAFVAGVVLFVGLAFQATSVYAAPPFFDPQPVSISEAAVQGTQATPKLYAFDPEQGENNLTYTEVPASGDGNALFDVSSTGFIILAQANQLDFETKTQYKMDVQVKDNNNETSVATITINITDASDEDPVMNDQVFAVDENKANGSLVGTIVVTDLDASDAAGNAFTFTINSGNTNNTFTIVNNTREIRVNNSTALNHEVTPSYTLGVTVKDGGQNSDTATITINVNNLNEPPVFVTPLPTPTVSENAANDTPVGSPVQATDPESNSITYSIVGSTPFKINATTGQIAVGNTNQLDHETAPTVPITVRATDNGAPPRSVDAVVTITVSDANDPPKAIAIPNEVVNEGAGPSNINLLLYFNDDEDTPDQLDYSVESNSNPNLFESVGINGNHVLVLTYKANASGKAELVIRAYDTAGAWVESTLTVDINDAPTTNGIANFSVNEDAADTTIDLWDVFDDAEDDDDELVYAVVSNSNSGVVATSISGQRNLVLDYLDNAFGAATIKVKATDRGGLVKDTTFTVTVVPVNDAPTTSGINDVLVMEDAPDKVIDLYTSFSDVETADQDLVFDITVNTNPNLFTGGSPSIANGQLTIKFKPDTSGEATLAIRATDNGPAPNKTVTASFKVTVNSAADKPVLSDFGRSTNEDTDLVFTKADFEANFIDNDGDDLAKIRIVSLPNKGTLKKGSVVLKVNDEVNAAELGTLTFVPEENWDTGTTVFEWNASDGTSYADKAAKVTITVNAVNDPPTVFDINKSGDEDKTLEFAKADFSSLDAYLDVENDPLVTVRIVTLPANGTLKLGTTDVTVNQNIGANNLDTLKFVPNANWSGTTSFEWNGSDGSLFAAQPATVNITINFKNDAPQLDLNGPASGTGYNAEFNANADAVIVGGPNMTLVDPDGGTMEAAYIKIANPLDGAAEKLDADKTGTAINVSYNASKSMLTLQGPDTIENFVKVLKTVIYSNTAATPNSTPRQVQFEVYDGQAFSNTATTTVDIIRPQISLSVDKPFQTVISGDTAIFALTIANTGDINLANVTLTSTVADCNKGLVKEMLAAGDSLPPIVCSVTNVTQRINNVLKLTAEDTTGGPPVTAEVTAVVRVTNPNIYVEILADPAVGYTVAKGADVPLLVIVGNPSQARLENVTLTPTLSPIAVGDESRAQNDIDLPANISCNFDVISLNGNQEREFNCTVTAVAAPIAVEVSAVGTIEGTQNTVEDFDRAEINVLDIVIQATSDLFEVPAANATDVKFNITLINQGNTPVSLTELTSRSTSNQLLHGDLLDVTNSVVKDSTCATLGNAPVLEAGGGTFACSYTASVVAELPLFVNRISFTVADEDTNTFSSSKDIEITVTDEMGVRAILNANPNTLLAPGGDIQLLVQIRNNQPSAVSLEGLEDSQVGDLNGVGDCAVPQEIAAGESYLCSYAVTRTGLSAGDELKFVLTATVDGELLTDDVIVRVTERGARRAMLPAVSNAAVVGEPNNRSCDAMALMPNMDNYFYADDLDDWYRVVVKSAGPLEVRLKNFKVEGQLIVYIAPNCSAISNEEGKRFSDGSVNNPSKSVILNAATPGTYFIRVYGSINSSTGQPNTSTEPYMLHIDTP
jgi:hypothetical protein